MTPLFTKLNLKDQADLLVLNVPGGFEAGLARLKGRMIHRRASDLPVISFALIFVQTAAEIDDAWSEVHPRAPGDPVLWLAYPKASSKRYRCGFNRDNGWDTVGATGFEPVRQIAIDEDWSALRFRRVEHIKTMTRHKAGAISPEGKARTKQALKAVPNETSAPPPGSADH
jgi:hypothetical protein